MSVLRPTLLSLALLLPGAVFAQVPSPGTPPSFAPSGDSLRFSGAEEVLLPAPDVDAAREEDALFADEKNHPQRFGLTLPVDISPDSHGSWSRLDDGRWTWRLTIRSPGAYHLNLSYTDFDLAEGAELYLYSEDREQVLGAFTSRNNKADGSMSTALVRGEAVTLEYVEPAEGVRPTPFRISSVTYGYVQSMAGGDQLKGFNSSDACEVNVACDPDSQVLDTKRGVARILLTTERSGYWCSGTLINNTQQDGTGLFLTANHCLPDGLRNVMFYFNYESSATDGCDNPAIAPTPDTIDGFRLIARSGTSDFALLELGEVPAPSYDLWLAGWDTSTLAPASAYGIHHPAGDIKKISRSSTIQTEVGPTLGVSDLWQVRWSSGVTEGGSSGSPLFDDNGRVIGQLLGGASYCSSPLARDIYGKISNSFTGDGTPTSRLSDALDPTGTGATSIAGADLNVLLTPPPACDGVCIAAENAIDTINSRFEAVVVHDAAPTRLQPATIDAEFRDLAGSLAASTCTASPFTVDGELAGQYHSGQNLIDGSWEGGPLSNGQIGPGHIFRGEMSGGETFGDLFSSYNKHHQFVADRGDGGFVAGRWARIRGRRGVFFGVHGTCSGIRPADALSDWYIGDLSAWL